MGFARALRGSNLLYKTKLARRSLVSDVVRVRDSTVTFSRDTSLGYLASGNALVRQGDSVIHAVVTTKSPLSGAEYEGITRDENEVLVGADLQNFLPLTVDYRYRSYASGLIPQLRNRRERNNNEECVLVSRLIDRAVRPLFPKGYVDEVQVLATTHAADGKYDPTIMSVNAASLALMRSNCPWAGPIGCVRVGLIPSSEERGGAEGGLYKIPNKAVKNSEYSSYAIVVNPTNEQRKVSVLDLVYAGTSDSALMVEAVGNEIPEDIMGIAMEKAQQAVKDIIDTQLEIFDRENPKKGNKEIVGTDSKTQYIHISPSGDFWTGPEIFAAKHLSSDYMCSFALKDGVDLKKVKEELDALPITNLQAIYDAGTFSGSLQEYLDTSSGDKKGSSSYFSLSVPEEMQLILEEKGLPAAIKILGQARGLPRRARGVKEGEARQLLLNLIEDHSDFKRYPKVIKGMAADGLMKKAFRDSILKDRIRIDGRSLEDVRPLSSQVDVLPVVHGSSFFCRGDTHVLATTTLGPQGDTRYQDALDGSTMDIDGISHNFYLHYDFPPYCTGEVGSLSTNRRMVGHGNLAEKAIRPVIPDIAEFPYAIRVFAECTSSSGSSSMASACSASLALMDAGVPIKAPVAGVSIGLLVSDDDKSNKTEYTLLRDILGTEDYYGEMDFKIAGTRTGVTAMQLDTKLSSGIPLSVMGLSLLEAKAGRTSILDNMDTSIKRPRNKIKHTAPHAFVVNYDPERAVYLLGPGGKMLHFIEEEYNCTVDASNSTSREGVAYIYGQDEESTREAYLLVQDLVSNVEPGDVFDGQVTEIKDFGVFIKISRAQEALLHISELSHDYAVRKRPLDTLMSVGQRIKVQVLSVDKGTGTVRVSRKALLKKDAVDHLEPSPVEETSQNTMVDLPEWPHTPPRPWSRDFFRINVVSESDIQASMKSQKEGKDSVGSGGNGEISRSRRRHSNDKGNTSNSKNYKEKDNNDGKSRSSNNNNRKEGRGKNNKSRGRKDGKPVPDKVAASGGNKKEGEGIVSSIFSSIFGDSSSANKTDTTVFDTLNDKQRKKIVK